jgi:transposase-like protein
MELARSSGITSVSLRTWRDFARKGGRFMAGGKVEKRWTSAEKFRAVLETAPMSEAEAAEYCRAKAIMLPELQEWRAACEQANGSEPRSESVVENPTALARIKTLERELRRKDAALAEAAALLILRKKADAIWGKGEDD